MYKQPFFTVIIATYNREAFIADAVKSVIEQSFGDFQLIIVDDGSTDNTSGIVSSFEDKRITYIYQQNSERSAARNKGIELSEGLYICFLDSDDTFKPGILETYYNFLKEKNFPEAFVFSDIELVNPDNGNVLKTAYPAPSDDALNYFFINSIGTVQVCISGELLVKQKFNPEINVGEDKELWLRLSPELKIYYIPVAGVKVIDHSERTVFVGNKEAPAGHLRTLKYILKQPYAKSINRLSVKKVLSNAYVKMGYHFAFHKQNIAACLWFLKGLFICPGYRTKERVFLIIDSTFIGHLLINVFRKINI